MALKSYQRNLDLSKLYEVKRLASPSGEGSRINPSIWANNLISIYGSDSATQPSDLNDMTLDSNNTDVSGNLVFGKDSVIPRYIAITGNATEVVASGLELTELSAIS